MVVRLTDSIKPFLILNTMNKRFLSAPTIPLLSVPAIVVASIAAVVTIGLTAVSPLTTPAMAKTFPGSSSVVMPCYGTNCVTLRERLNIFQGLGKSKPAIDYCREKYGNEATVEWWLGLRWCATPFQM
jgi:hypothetical protein